MCRRLALAFALAFAACLTTANAQPLPALDDAVIFVRPGIADLNLTVGAFLACLQNGPRPMTVTTKRTVAPGRYLVRTSSPPHSIMSFFFETISDKQVLLVAGSANAGAGELISDSWKELLMLVAVLVEQTCGASPPLPER